MNRQSARIRNQRGNAMVLSLLILLLLTTIGVGYVLQSKTETQIAGNGLRHSQALFNAEAGITEGLARMSNAQDSTNFIGQGFNTVDPGWGVYIVDANGSSDDDPDHDATASDGRDNNLDGQVDESNEAYPEVGTKQTGSDKIPYPWVRVEYVLNSTGDVIRYGDHDNDLATPQEYNIVAGAPVIRITAEGDRGNALRRVEVEAIKPEVDIVKAAIYTERDDFKFNGTQFLVSGQDWDPSTGSVVPGSSDVLGIATTKDPDNISGALSGQQQNNVEGSGAEPSVDSAPADIDMQALYDQWSPLADIKVPAGTYSNIDWGNYDDYHVVQVQGDLHNAGGVSGGGILLVNGDFTCTGQFTWYGLVVVMGDISFSGGGAGVHIYGSTMVQGQLDTETVGGNADILYSSAALKRLVNLGPYKIVAWVEN